MDSGWWTLLPLALGIGIGVGIVALILTASHRGRRAASVVSPAVPDGVDEVLAVLESAGLVVDPSGNVVGASDGALALGLVRAGRLADRELDELAIRVRESGEPESLEMGEERERFGSLPRPLHVRGARLGVRYILILAEDRTDALRLDEVRRDFIANISHELKTPIGAINLLAETLEPAAGDPEQVRRFALRLRQEAERLARITADIIDLSRLQATEAVHVPEPVGLRAVLEQAVDQNRVAAEAAEIELVVGGDRDGVVFGDAKMLQTAVKNLVSNAVHYSPAGGRVGVGVSRSDGMLDIAVTDQGIGIPEEDRERVFERFFRVDPSRARNTGGTGLGLSIVKHTVQNHGGSVRVWSQLGRGSTFTISLPDASASGLTTDITETEHSER